MSLKEQDVYEKCHENKNPLNLSLFTKTYKSQVERALNK